MKIVLTRFGFGLDSTLGRLEVPGLEPCYTLEDERRIQKVHSETAIPAGTYELALRGVGGFHNRYKADARFRDIHRGMLHLLDVPGFSWILVHCGNDDGHTAGCILVGEHPIMTDAAEFKVGRSADAYRRIYPTIADAIERGDRVEVEIRQAEPLP